MVSEPWEFWIPKPTQQIRCPHPRISDRTEQKTNDKLIGINLGPVLEPEKGPVQVVRCRKKLPGRQGSLSWLAM